MKRPWRSTIRVRLTLLYAGAFFLAGLVLVAWLYLYFEHTLRTHVPPHLAPDLSDQVNVQARQKHADTMRAVLNASLITLAAVAVSATGLGWLLAGRALRPLQDITATARRVADRNLHERIALQGPDDEIKYLADTFDAMLERLDRAFDHQRRFVANASHELRTPLTINRVLIEVALDGENGNEPLQRLGTDLLAVNRRHERLIDGLLTLASSEERLATCEPVDLAGLVRCAASGCEAVAHGGDIAIRVSLARAPVVGDPVLLERLAHNLIDNAIRYNQPDHGWVRIATGVDAGHAVLTVENTGPVVPDTEVPDLFEPFRRLPANNQDANHNCGSGAGLGLSIVRSVTHAHGGDVTANTRQAGGLTVRVQLPAQDLDGR
jgi:signal transduction histidine kinase